MSRDYPPSAQKAHSSGYPPTAPPHPYYAYGYPPTTMAPSGNVAQPLAGSPVADNRPTYQVPNKATAPVMPPHSATKASQPPAASPYYVPGQPTEGTPPAPGWYGPPLGYPPPPYPEYHGWVPAVPASHPPPPPAHSSHYSGHPIPPPPQPVHTVHTTSQTASPPKPPAPKDGRYWRSTTTSSRSRRSKTSERSNEVDGREGATSPSQIETHHRDEVQHMGCTCKKTRCLKLYCQCFGVKIYCGINCRCLQCYNSRKHEKERKEAMRSILSRNSSAFDTKFKKTGLNVAPTASAPADPKKALAHKVGCKCRKSACMKKYCECYAGNVKCSPSCRCMGCKNMGGNHEHRERPPDFQNPAYPIPPPRHHLPPPHPHHMPVHVPSPPTRPPAPAHSNGEPWVAAQNLTFLKRGSPASSEKKLGKAATLDSGEIASMPSLASSSEGTSPGDHVGNGKKLFTTDTHEEALLMAAVAMTEFGQSPPPSATKKRPSPEEETMVGNNSMFSPLTKVGRSENDSVGLPVVHEK